MQFQVPQFIEVEDKIFGPLTFRQFVYLAGGAALCFLTYRFLPVYIAFLLIPPLALFALALAFYKINDKPFILILEAAIRYYLGSRLYLWQKKPTEVSVENKPAQAGSDALAVLSPKLSDSKLKDLAWSLDVNEKIGRSRRG